LKFEATGFFKAHHDGKRWWLVAPDGYAFWSSGLDCVRPDTDANIEGLEDALRVLRRGGKNGCRKQFVQQSPGRDTR